MCTPPWSHSLRNQSRFAIWNQITRGLSCAPRILLTKPTSRSQNQELNPVTPIQIMSIQTTTLNPCLCCFQMWFRTFEKKDCQLSSEVLSPRNWDSTARRNIAFLLQITPSKGCGEARKQGHAQCFTQVFQGHGDLFCRKKCKGHSTSRSNECA